MRAGDELLAVMRPGGGGGMWTTHFGHADGLGSVRAITDESGVIVDTRAYEAFGTKNVEAGTETLAYGFAGEPLDGTTHLAYHRARWMDSRAGRFDGMDRVEADPRRPISLHRYVYGGDEPSDRVDPTGNDDIGSLSAGLGGFGSLFGEANIATLFRARRGTGNGGQSNGSYPTYDAALNAALSKALQQGVPTTYLRTGLMSGSPLASEVGGFLYFQNNGWSFTTATSHQSISILDSDLQSQALATVPSDAIVFALFHTHPNAGPTTVILPRPGGHTNYAANAAT